MNLQTLLTDTVCLVVLLSAIPLGATLVVGLVLSVLQAATQIQEQTITFVPKLIVMFVVLFFFGPWMTSQVAALAQGILESIVHFSLE